MIHRVGDCTVPVADDRYPVRLLGSCPVCGQLPGFAAALVLAGGFAKMTRPGESGFEAEPAQVDEWASGIGRWGWRSSSAPGALRGDADKHDYL